MANLDRPGLIELLERFGADDDETVLRAARELHRSINDSGYSWDDLLIPEAVSDGMNAEAAGENPPAEEDELEERAAEAAEATAVAPGRDEDLKLINRLLERTDLSRDMRQELVDLKQDIADGTFNTTDSHYIRALAKRLGRPSGRRRR